MKSPLCTTALLLILAALVSSVQAQTMQLGEVLIVASPSLPVDVDTSAFEARIVDTVAPLWKEQVPGVELHLLSADRGDRSGEPLLVWMADTEARRTAYASEDETALFSKSVLASTSGDASFASTYLSDEKAFTEYVLIGADQLEQLPKIDILGIHFIKVRPDRAAAFEQFVRDSLHPAVANVTPGMGLLYYKGVRGQEKGSYITVYAIESVARRETFWPTNAPEKEIVKSSFAPLKPIAHELRTYLIDDSYLKEDTGAGAAIFESLEWTDFVHVGADRPQ